MKVLKNRNQLLLLLLAAGFLTGILYENLVSKNGGGQMEIFQSYFLKQFAQARIVAEEYLWYVVRARVAPLLLLCVLARLRWKKTAAGLLTAWSGFLFGVAIVAAVLQLGAKGILFCLAGFLPHMACYVLAYSVVLLYLYHYPRRQWCGAKTVFVILMFVLGIVLETYLSPFLIRLAVQA